MKVIVEYCEEDIIKIVRDHCIGILSFPTKNHEYRVFRSQNGFVVHVTKKPIKEGESNKIWSLIKWLISHLHIREVNKGGE
jgi:hypothetical protein